MARIIKSVNRKRVDRFQSMRLTFFDTRSLDLAKKFVGVSPVQTCKLSKGQRLLGPSIIVVAGEGLTHRQLCSSSQGTPAYQDSQGHPSLLLLPPMLTKSIFKVIDLGVRMLNKNLILRACSGGGV